MVATLDFARYLGEIRAASADLAECAERAGLDTVVPTCPGWVVADLVAHQGMVHRWAAANLLGEKAPFREESAVLASIGRSALSDWFRDGVEHLLDTLTDVREDVDAYVFLLDAGRPRDFWARRQAHETTIHAVDALAAQLGRTPTADEVGIGRDLALDGIDELVCGFLPRGYRAVRFAEPVRLAVEPVDSDRRWTLTIGPDRIRTEPGLTSDCDATFSGTAAGLYVGMWNRGDDFVATGTPVLDEWRAQQQVRWG